MIFADPLRGTLRVTRAYGDTRQYVNGVLVATTGPPHLGVDLGAACGTPVLAAAPGVVAFSGWDSQGGNLVKIGHFAGDVWTEYAHLATSIVREGQRVTQGQVIGAVGKTGNATGCHLHFAVKTSGGFVDPWPLLAQNAGAVSGGSMAPAGPTGIPGSLLEALGKSEGSTFTTADITVVIAWADAQHLFPADLAGNLARDRFRAILSSHVGQTVAVALHAAGVEAGNQPTGLGSLIDFSWIPALVVNGVLLLVIVMLVFRGLDQVLEA